MYKKYAINQRVLSTGKFCYPEPATMRGTFVSSKVAVTISTITTVSSTATATTATAHGLVTGDTVNITGANQAGYNGKKRVTVTSPTVFTFTVLVGTVSPATGTPILTLDGAYATGTGTFAGEDFKEGDWIYVPAQDALRQVADVLSPTRWKFSESFTTNLTTATPVIISYPEQKLIRGFSVNNKGAANGVFMETTLEDGSDDGIINLFEEAGLCPVCGDATGTTFSIIITY